MSIDTVTDVKIGGKEARLYVYRKYDETKRLSGPVAHSWEIWIADEGIVASGTEIRDTDSRKAMWARVDRLRKERRKKKGQPTEATGAARGGEHE